MTAVRLAREYTKKSKIIKFAGCYHGHSDVLLAGVCSEKLSAIDTLRSDGVVDALNDSVIVLEFGNINSIEAVLKAYADEIACVILEPVPGNMNMVVPDVKFLQKLRQITKESGVVLIFDEVMSGFRVALGGAQQVYNIKPDISIFGKVIGAGMPVAGIGGRHDIMSLLAPIGNVYHAGTLSGHPLCLSVGAAVLNILKEKDFSVLEKKAQQITTCIT